MKFLNSIFGSYVKVFISAILTMIIAKGDIYQVTLKESLSAGIIALLPVVINYLNPHDPRYGSKK